MACLPEFSEGLLDVLEGGWLLVLCQLEVLAEAEYYASHVLCSSTLLLDLGH